MNSARSILVVALLLTTTQAHTNVSIRCIKDNGTTVFSMNCEANGGHWVVWNRKVLTPDDIKESEDRIAEIKDRPRLEAEKRVRAEKDKADKDATEQARLREELAAEHEKAVAKLAVQKALNERRDWVRVMRTKDPNIEKLIALKGRWDESVLLASSTPRIALAGPVSRLQDLKDQASTLVVAVCYEKARGNLIMLMKSEIFKFFAFMQEDKKTTSTIGNLLINLEYDFYAAIPDQC